MLLYYLSGLPRTGSTILANVLAQNPLLHVSSTSGLPSTINVVRSNWSNIVEHKTSNKTDLLGVLRGVMTNYHQTTKPVIIDKNRAWLREIALIEKIFGIEAKIIVTLRDMRAILASWEMLQRRNPEYQHQQTNSPLGQTLAGRLQIYTEGTHPVGMAYNWFIDALQSGYKNRLHIVHYEQLLNDPLEVITGIYKFLGLDLFEHDFNNITQAIVENDHIYGYPDLHKIAPKLKKSTTDWRKVLGGELGQKYNVDWRVVIDKYSTL